MCEAKSKSSRLVLALADTTATYLQAQQVPTADTIHRETPKEAYWLAFSALDLRESGTEELYASD